MVTVNKLFRKKKVNYDSSDKRNTFITPDKKKLHSLW